MSCDEKNVMLLRHFNKTLMKTVQVDLKVSKRFTLYHFIWVM